MPAPRHERTTWRQDGVRHGRTGGIGRAICARFAADGAPVIAADIGDWTDPPSGIEVRRFDVINRAGIASVFAQLSAESAQLDVLVSTAGFEIEEMIDETSLEDWSRLRCGSTCAGMHGVASPETPWGGDARLRLRHVGNAYTAVRHLMIAHR